MGLIENDDITEASGMAASIQNPGVIWAHNDSGDKNRIFAFNTKGKDLGSYYLDLAVNRDWEDMALGPGPEPGKFYLYLGEIGDNYAQNKLNLIYRVVEPQIDSSQLPVTELLSNVEKIRFIYPDGKRDAETLMIDPLNKDLYIISKREPQIRLYRLPFPQTTQDTTIAEFMINLNLTNVVGGDISPSGKEILIKTYTEVFYWFRSPDQPILETLISNPTSLPYIIEPQGEAICWQSPDSGYFTVSEEAFGIPTHLYYYPRVGPASASKTIQKIITEFNLEQNYPNPFNSTTSIIFRLNCSAVVNLEIFNIVGERISSILTEKILIAGEHHYKWDASKSTSGTYICRIKAGNQIESRKLILQK